MDTWHSPDNLVTLAYESVGDGRPVVLLHAFPLCREMWASQRGLADRFRVVTPDLFGFGGSPVPAAGWTMDSMADALAAFLSGIGIDQPIVLGGLSMGGYAALAFARKYPDRLRGLVLADTKAEADNAWAKASRDKMITLVRENSAATVVEEMLPKLLGDFTRANRPAVVAEARRIGSAQSVDGVAAALAALRDRPDATPTLASIRVPTLVVVGAEDTLTPPDGARKMASAIPDVKVVVIPTAGHLSNLECPAEFTTAVRMFLASL
ncbi:MAG TPA: alpha/beta fold hydrolase [Fimbriiglobus sp.]|jgi:pimeloyl-ACP methyl ester carboxylesterase|nr:alpha/beta fold hydrolase [Fimbriiglobus sp.]